VPYRFRAQKAGIKAAFCRGPPEGGPQCQANACDRHASAGVPYRSHYSCSDIQIVAHPWHETLSQTVLTHLETSRRLFGFWPSSPYWWVTLVGMGLAVLPCVLVALYLSEYARSATRAAASRSWTCWPQSSRSVWRVGLLASFLRGDTLHPIAKRWLGGIARWR